MYPNHSIHFGLCLRHVPNVQGYFDGLLGDADMYQVSVNGTPLETRARIQAMHVNPNYVVKLPKTRVNTVGILKY